VLKEVKPLINFKKMKYLTYLFFVIALIGCNNPNNTKKEQKLPNIILVFTDDLGYGDLGCYGQQRIQTPNIDKMAQKGMKFTSFYSGAPVCAPSRCNLLTGKHAGSAFIRHNINQLPLGQLPIPDNEVILPELLKQKGYKTAAMGKWSLGAPGNSGNPLQQGFDYFFGNYCQCKAHNYYPEMLWRNTDSVKLRNITIPVEVNFIDYPLSYATSKIDNSAELVFNEAIDFIENNKTNPFFLYYATALPHSNGEAPVDEKFEVPDWGIYKDSTWLPYEKGYASMVSMLDKQMGVIFKTLDSLGIANNTLVIFTSDNGPTNFATILNSSGNLRGRKRDLYEAGIRVPFIAQWLGKVPEGTIVKQPAAMYDLLNTFSEMAGIKPQEHSNGRSILPTLLGEKQNDPDVLYWEFYEGERAPKQAVRKGDWKLLRFNFLDKNNQELELYNLAVDIGERQNIAKDYPKKVAELIKLLDREHSDYVNINFDPK